MPPSIEINCSTILIDRQSVQNGLYRRGGAFARIRLDFCVMRLVRECGMGSRRQGDKETRGQGDKGNKISCPLVSTSPCPLVLHSSLPIIRTPDSPASAIRRLSGRPPDKACCFRSRPCPRCPGGPRACFRRIHG